MENEIPKELLARYPQFQQVDEAFQQYRAGLEVTVHCTVCGGLIIVVESKEIGVTEVSCPKGCTHYRSRWDPKMTVSS